MADKYTDKDNLEYFWQKILALPRFTGLANIATKQVTIAVADWSSNTCTKTVTGVTADSLVVCSYDIASKTAYTECGVYCSAQARNSLTFACNTTPTVAVTVNVAVMDIREQIMTAEDKEKLDNLATVATSGSYNDLSDTPKWLQRNYENLTSFTFDAPISDTGHYSFGLMFGSTNSSNAGFLYLVFIAVDRTTVTFQAIKSHPSYTFTGSSSGGLANNKLTITADGTVWGGISLIWLN